MTFATPDLSAPIHEAIFWRGLFIHRYAGVEHAITELLVRAGGREEYAAFGKLPFPWPKRLKLLTKVLDALGPIQPYAELIRAKLTPLTGLEVHRHMLVHGMMAVDVGGDDPRHLYFRGYSWLSGDLGETTIEMSVDDLIAMTQSIGPLTQDLTRSIAVMFNEIGLEPIMVDPRQNMPISNRAI
jgi:hypothetical protein